MRLDLGATAKGFLVDTAVAVLKSYGLRGFLVMAGGDGYAFGKRPDGSKWQIAIADPSTGSQVPSPQSSKIYRVLEISDKAVTTSGNYERGYVIGGKHRSHIINPRTGKPCDSVPSVTVIADDAFTADAASTAFSVMADELGVKATLETAKYAGAGEVLILMREGDKLVEHCTEGFSKHYKK
jgi:thiamine biosynthesis lipoprotein